MKQAKKCVPRATFFWCRALYRHDAQRWLCTARKERPRYGKKMGNIEYFSLLSPPTCLFLKPLSRFIILRRSHSLDHARIAWGSRLCGAKEEAAGKGSPK